MTYALRDLLTSVSVLSVVVCRKRSGHAKWSDSLPELPVSQLVCHESPPLAQLKRRRVRLSVNLLRDVASFAPQYTRHAKEEAALKKSDDRTQQPPRQVHDWHSASQLSNNSDPLGISKSECEDTPMPFHCADTKCMTLTVYTLAPCPSNKF